MSSVKDEATNTALKYYKRVIAQALQEGASDEAVDAYVAAQGVKEPAKYRISVQTNPIKRLLGWPELEKLGGRNTFRTLFGLPAVDIKPQEALDFGLTESGDSELFAEMYGDVLRYDRLRERWLVSDTESGLWLPDGTGHVYRLALKTMRERQARGVRIEDYALRKQMIDWAIHGESRSRLSNLLSLAEHVDPLYDDGKHWDEDPWLLGCLNGVVDLRTGEFRKATPEDRITMRVSVAFDPQAKCPLWLQTLAGVFQGHEVKSEHLLEQQDSTECQRIIDFIQRAIGYSITGDCREECCFFTWGDGGNGKGTIINTLGKLLHDYLDDMPYQTLEKNLYKSQGIPNDIAKIAAKRFITCAEVSEFTLNEARLKALTGRDPITARFLNKEFFTFSPVGKIWIATNNKPKITGIDEGIWRRIHLIPFTNTFEGPNKNDRLKDMLLDELPGILNWCIAGCLAWQQHGLMPPETVRVATEGYRRDSEPITPFLAACCVVDARCKVQAKVLWEAYCQWALGQHGEERLSDKAFSKCMKRRFTCESGRHVHYVGVGLAEKYSTDVSF